MSETPTIEPRDSRIETQSTRVANSWLARHWDGVRIGLGVQSVILGAAIPASFVEPGNPQKMVATYMLALAAEGLAAIIFVPESK